MATTLFAKKGLDATTTREIARESGLNISLISYYFGGKTGLYKTIIYEHALEMKRKLEDVVHAYGQRELTPAIFQEELEVIIRQLVDMRLGSSSIAKIFMAERTQGMPYAKEVFEGLMATSCNTISEMMIRGQKKGFLRADFSPRSFLLVMVESIFGYFMVQECRLSVWKDTYQLPKDKEDFIHFLVQLFTKGILK